MNKYECFQGEGMLVPLRFVICLETVANIIIGIASVRKMMIAANARLHPINGIYHKTIITIIITLHVKNKNKRTLYYHIRVATNTTILPYKGRYTTILHASYCHVSVANLTLKPQNPFIF